MAQKIRFFAHSTNRGILRLWSWLLLAALGLLTTLTGCWKDVPVPLYGAPVPAYGVQIAQPMYGVPAAAKLLAINPDQTNEN
jgi:hypothetical protein